MVSDIADAAEAMLAALKGNTVFPESLSRRFSFVQGYDVQFELLKRRKAQGDVHVGWKFGLTSQAMQLQQGVHEPCLGHLVEAGHVSSPAVFCFDELMAPGFENELCIRLGAPLDGDATARSVRSAIDAIAPAIEVVEKRGVFNADLALAFAGNAQQRAFVTGEFVPLADDVDPAAIEVEVFVNGQSQECALGAERDIIAWMRGGIGAGARLASEAEVEAGLAASGLNHGQREAVRTVLLSPHRLVGVQGYAGAGKTTMLRAVVELAGRERRIVGLTPSSSATGVLARETGMRARTLQGFLLRYRDVGNGVAGPRLMAGARQVLGGSLVVVDEASMVSTTQMRSLMRIAGRAGAARLVLVGDRRELRSVEAGQPFGLLQEAGMPGAVMDEVMRQRDPALKDAVLHMIARDPALAVEDLGNGVLEMDADALGESAARLWLDLGAGARTGTEILAPTHRLRAEINAAVRTGLAAEGVLHGRVLTTERYVNLHLTRAQKGDPGNYREGDVAIFNHDVYGITVRGGDACRIAGIEDERVRLEHPDGRPRRIDPSGYLRYRLELYETEPILLQAGDAVRWTRNDNQRRLVNGERADIVAIGARNVRIRAQDGRVLVLRRDDPQLHHLDHAYSSTVHAAQGITCDNVIAVLDSDDGPLTDQATFYVELTRARDNVVLLTDDKEALVEALETRTGEQLSALEAIGEQFASPARAPVAAVRDKEPLWPALAAWRAFAEQALRRGKDPFEAQGCEDAVAPLLALADGAGPPDGIPGDVARIAAEHAARREAAARDHVENLRGTIEACVEERHALLVEAAGAGSGGSVHALPGWGRWRGRTRLALAAWRETLADEGRYGAHVDRLEGRRTRIGESVETLETALRVDGLRGALLQDWQALDERARTGGVPRFGDEGYEALIGRTEAFAREAVRPGEMPRGLARLLEEHEARGRARAFVRDRLLPAFSACVEERGALLAEALRTGTALTDMPPGRRGATRPGRRWRRSGRSSRSRSATACSRTSARVRTSPSRTMPGSSKGPSESTIGPGPCCRTGGAMPNAPKPPAFTRFAARGTTASSGASGPTPARRCARGRCRAGSPASSRSTRR